jgi:diguanylate cyclase (GGDEF)-like protein
LKQRISAGGWLDLARWTGLGTLACIAISMIYNFAAFRSLGAEALRQALISAVVLPVILAGPMFSYLTLKMRRLSIANRQLGVVASIDRLTSCFNRGAFTDKVNAYLDRAEFGTVAQCGALLVIDADHFKTINDRFGHEHGDEALTTIARTIRSMLRAGDIVGRLGGEEFGVFLPGVDLPTASLIAERIRRSVNVAVFAPGGELRQLSVSIGGAVFDMQTDFEELFRIADRRLYEAKSFGRNRVEVAPTRLIHYAVNQHASVA